MWRTGDLERREVTPNYSKHVKLTFLNSIHILHLMSSNPYSQDPSPIPSPGSPSLPLIPVVTLSHFQTYHWRSIGCAHLQLCNYSIDLIRQWPIATPTQDSVQCLGPGHRVISLWYYRAACRFQRGNVEMKGFVQASSRELTHGSTTGYSLQLGGTLSKEKWA